MTDFVPMSQLNLPVTSTPMADKEPTWGEAMDAAFETRSGLMLGVRGLFEEPPPALTDDENAAYRAFEWSVREDVGHRYPQYVDMLDVFADMKSPAQVDWMAEKVRKEIAAMNMMSNAGFLKSLVTETAAELLNPWELFLGAGKIPVGVGKAALSVGVKSAGLVAVNEAILQQQRQLITGGESLAYIGTAGILGAGLGGAVAKRPAIGGTDRLVEEFVAEETMRKAAFEFMEKDLTVSSGAGQAAESTASAARVDPTQIDVTEVASMDDLVTVLEDIWNTPEIAGQPSREERVVGIFEQLGASHKLVKPSLIKAAGLGILHRISPDIWGMLAESDAYRMFTNMLMGHNLQTVGPRRPAAEVGARMRAHQSHSIIHQSWKKGWGEYKARIKQESPDIEPSELDFARQVQIAMTKNDQSAIPEVNKVSGEIRAALSHLTKRMEDSGQLMKWVETPERVEYKLNPETGELDEIVTPASIEQKRVVPLGDDTWFPRMYSQSYALKTTDDEWVRGFLPGIMRQYQKDLDLMREQIEELNKFQEGKIREESKRRADGKVLIRFNKEFKTDVAGKKTETGRKAEYGTVEEKIAYKRQQNEAKVMKAEDKIRKRETEHLKNMRQEIAKGEAAKGSAYTAPSLYYDQQGNPQIVPMRTLNIATEDIPPDALHSNPLSAILQATDRLERMMTIVEDPRFGDPTFQNWKRALDLEYDAKKAALKGDQKATNKLIKEYKRNRNAIDKLAKRLFNANVSGASPIARSLTDAVKTGNNLRLLGGVMWTVSPEFFAPVMTTGIRSMVRMGADTVLNAGEMKKMTKRQKEILMMGNEIGSTSRLSDTGMFELEADDTFKKLLNKWQQLGDFTVDKAFGLGIWTRYAKIKAGAMIMMTMGDMAMKKTLSKTDKMALNRMGLDDELWAYASENIRKHSTTMDGGTIDIHMEKWPKGRLWDETLAGIHQEIDNTILTPGIGSRPFIGDTLTGSLMLQYKTFTTLATSRYWMAGIQRLGMGDMRPAIQFALISTSAAMATRLRIETRPKEARREWDATDYVREGIIYGGMSGLVGDLSTIVGAATGGYDAFSLLPGFDPVVMSKYRGTQTVWGGVAGPTMSLGSDLITALRASADVMTGEGPTLGGIRAFKRTLPYNNYLLFNLPYSEQTGVPSIHGATSKLYEMIGRDQ